LETRRVISLPARNCYNWLSGGLSGYRANSLLMLKPWVELIRPSLPKSETTTTMMLLFCCLLINDYDNRDDERDDEKNKEEGEDNAE